MTRYQKLVISGAVLALVPFVIFLGFTQVSTSNGNVTSYSYLNVAAIVGGLIAIGLAVSSMRKPTPSAPATPQAWRMIAVAVALLGVVQVVRGLGVFPMITNCTSTSSAPSFCKPAPSAVDAG